MGTGITRQQAQGFYADLCGTYNGSANKTGQGIASVSHIAESMGIAESKANEYCNAMMQYGITERQNGKVVI